MTLNEIEYLFSTLLRTISPIHRYAFNWLVSSKSNDDTPSKLHESNLRALYIAALGLSVSILVRVKFNFLRICCDAIG